MFEYFVWLSIRVLSHQRDETQTTNVFSLPCLCPNISAYRILFFYKTKKFNVKWWMNILNYDYVWVFSSRLYYTFIIVENRKHIRNVQVIPCLCSKILVYVISSIFRSRISKPATNEQFIPRLRSNDLSNATADSY